jgi:DNA-binding MarR family transcriptional regulator
MDVALHATEARNLCRVKPDCLAQQGLFLRSEDPKDRQVKQIALTNQGRAVLQQSLLARQSWIGSLAEVMTDPVKV